MQLDIPTLMVTFAAIAVATAGALIRFEGLGNARVTVRIWVRGYVLMALGMGLLTLAATWVTSAAFVVFSQVVIYLGALHLPAALAMFTRGHVAVRRYAVALLGFAAAMSLSRYLGGFRYEAMVITTFYVGMCAASINALRFGKVDAPAREGRAGLLEWSMCSLFVVLAGVLAVHGGWVVFIDDGTENAIQRLLMLMSILIATGLTIGFHWLIHRDIASHLEQLNRELAEKNQRLTEFTYAVSHDLRSPITTVYGNLDLVLEDNDDLDGEARGRLLEARRGLARIEAMIEELLAWSKVDGMAADGQISDCRTCLQRALDHLRREVSAAGLVIDPFDLSVPVRCNPVLLSQVFQNLISNAIKYRHPQRSPHVRVSASYKERQWEISVRDNGSGIPEAEIGCVFDMFRRGSGHSDIGGAGVGLALCRRIVEKHGGRIWLESVLGLGTTVHVRLPA